MRLFSRMGMLLLALLLLAGCAKGEGANLPGAFTLQDSTRIAYTMTRDEVEGILGEPDRIDTESLDQDYVECYYEEEGFSAVFAPDGAMRAVKITSTEIETFGGIHVMHTTEKVKKIFPKAEEGDIWVMAAFRGAESISTNSAGLDENCFWIYYLTDEKGGIRRMILMDHTFASQGK